MVISTYVFSFWGLRPQIPTRPMPLDPVGDFCPQSLFCPPPKQISGYAPDCIPIGYVTGT